VPDYYDPHYDCQMELLRFDSRRPNPRYAPLIDHLKEKLTHVTVVASAPALGAALSKPVIEAAA
jgi:hypothetical protein